MALIVSTERLGSPGEESTRLERRGVVQKSLVYLTHSDQAPATCHIQPSPRENALCGYQGERLVPVPGAEPFGDVPSGLWFPMQLLIPRPRLISVPQIAAGWGGRISPPWRSVRAGTEADNQRAPSLTE